MKSEVANCQIWNLGVGPVLPDGQGQKIPRFGQKDTNST